MNNKFIKDLLYELKKDYGTQIRYINIDYSDVNIDTGKRSFIKSAYTFNAIILPRRTTRKFVQDIAYLAANKNFTYGGLNDYNEIKFIIDLDDLPKDLNISLDGYLIHNHKRYEKIEFELIEHEIAFMLSTKGVEGSKPYDIMPFLVQSTFQLQHRVNFELN